MIRYRLLLALAAVPLAVTFAVGRLRGRVTARDLDERFGGGGAGDTGPVQRGRCLWLHGASLGELTAARSLIEGALQRDADLRLIVTANTRTGREAVRAWALPRTEARLAPLDYRFALNAFLGRWQPEALIVIENEIWLNRFATCGERNIPLLLVGARLSAGSARTWQRLGGQALARAMGAVSYLAAQDPDSAERFRQLGVSKRALGLPVLLKGDVSVPVADPVELAVLRPGFQRSLTLLAASTHEGEEAQVLKAFATARKTRPALRLILAPRHPERGDDLAAMVGHAGLSLARRSRGEPPGKAAVYLADTLGEMGLWYRLAGLTFVGGSLVDRGGHTPFEPAALSSAILHGPHVANNAQAFAALKAGGGARLVRNATELSRAILTLTETQDAALALARAAEPALAPLRDGAAGRAAFWAHLARLTNNEALA